MPRLFAMLFSLTGIALAFPDSPPAQKTSPVADHWAFQMPSASVRDIDTLIGTNLEKAQLTPSPQASRDVLVRRAYHVLTGLLPTPSERKKHLADTRPGWLTHLIDDLLDRSAFGERWARHWLDVARYADTKGAASTENEDYPFAYTYRDWVVRAFNDSLPYDQFLHRQIAADLMDLPREELAALGFLTVGRSYGRTHLDIADRIDVATRSTMALTVACARCHDHKTDPIPTADYYGLYGVFNSSVIPRELPVIAEPSQEPAAVAYRTELEKKARQVHEYTKKCDPNYKNPPDFLNFNLARRAKLNQTERNKFRQLVGAVSKFQAGSKHAIPRAMVVSEKGKPFNPHIHERGNPAVKGEPVPRAFLSIFREKEEHFQQGSGRLEFAHRLTDERNPLTARVWANRVWMHLTGSPLVDSPGDFGPQTAEPLQRDLLDHLALFLQENQWSTKALIRHIMTSETWQRSSLGRDDRDPANHYFARANRQRKDLEAWRDSALQVSGRLVSKIGGTPFQLEHPSYEGRRTIYGKVRRGFLPSIMRAFDFPGSEEALMKRTATTTPTQALYLMNSPFLHGEARAISKKAPSIDDIYQTVLQRPPTNREKESAQSWLASARQSRTSGAWDYGYLFKDSLDFKPLPHFQNDQWRGRKKLPDPELGWLSWNAHGGHPEADRHAVLKWTAGESGIFSVNGTLKVPSKQGNGVNARIMRPDGKILGEWPLDPASESPTTLPKIEIEVGDELWFVVDSRGDVAFDGFKWSPEISNKSGLVASAAKDFGGPGLPPLAQLAQALLLSNEFFYID